MYVKILYSIIFLIAFILKNKNILFNLENWEIFILK